MFVTVKFGNATEEEKEQFLQNYSRFNIQKEVYDKYKNNTLKECMIQLDSLTDLWDLQDIFKDSYVELVRDENGSECIQI